MTFQEVTRTYAEPAQLELLADVAPARQSPWLAADLRSLRYLQWLGECLSWPVRRTSATGSQAVTRFKWTASLRISGATGPNCTRGGTPRLAGWNGPSKDRSKFSGCAGRSVRITLDAP